LIEVMVAASVVAMLSIIVYGAFDGLSRGKQALGRVNDRYHQGRSAITRIAAELSSAFLSMHQPLTQAQIRRLTIFKGTNGSPADRLDFTSFSHRRLVNDSHESDQNELSYFGSTDPNGSGKVDLVRREASIIDLLPTRGGEVLVLAEDIDLFDLKYLDPTSGLWNDTWDTSQLIGQPNRLPLQVKVTLALNGGINGKPVLFVTKVPMSMQAPLAFAVPR
jgi:general secretion pathway protein J